MAIVQLTQPFNMQVTNPGLAGGSIAMGGTQSTIVPGHFSAFFVMSTNNLAIHGVELIGDFTPTSTTYQATGTVTEAWFTNSFMPGMHITGMSYFISPSDWSTNFIQGQFQTLLGELLSGDDIIIGSTGADILTGLGGNDTLYGGKGADQLLGGSGVNTASYATATAGLFAGLEDANANSGDALGDTYDLIQNLTGSQFNDVLYGDAGNNVFMGLGGNDLMAGKAGADRFDGGVGIDSVSYDSTGGVRADLLAPATNTGAAAGDSFVSIENLYGSTFSDTLCGNNLANLLAGNAFPALASGSDFLIGRGGNDTLRGYDGNDRLEGDAGVDTLSGGAGDDVFIFNAPLNAVTNRDFITDFANLAGNNDRFELENSIFTKLGAGAAHALNPAFFRAGAAALDANDYVVYNRATGVLSYDVNGSVAGGTIAFAVLINKPVLTASDFVVI